MMTFDNNHIVEARLIPGTTVQGRFMDINPAEKLSKSGKQMLVLDFMVDGLIKHVYTIGENFIGGKGFEIKPVDWFVLQPMAETMGIKVNTSANEIITKAIAYPGTFNLMVNSSRYLGIQSPLNAKAETGQESETEVEDL